MNTGSKPVRKHTAPPGAPQKLRRLLAGDLDNIILTSLRKEPSRRYVSVEQFAEDIRRHLNGLPVSAAKASWRYRAAKFIGRHKAGVAATAILIVAILAGIAATLREARRADANARRAEQRFNDVRKLANSLIFEVNDSIEKVPGATAARKIILERALEYLDSLSKEAGNEPELLRELATAYERIGALQGDPMDSNLGDVKSAAINLRKSLDLRESLARINPGNSKDQYQLAVADLDYSEFQTGVLNNVTAGLDYNKRALDILERERAADPNNIRLIAQTTRAYTNLGILEIGNGAGARIGTVKEGVAAAQQALAFDQRGMQLDPNQKEFPAQEIAINILLGDGMLALGDDRQALAHYKRGLDLANSLTFGKNDVSVEHNAIVLTGKIADVMLAQEKISDAVTWYSKTLDGATRHFANDPTDAALGQLVITSSAQLGHALIESGRISDGLRYLQAAFDKVKNYPDQSPLTRIFQGLLYAWIGEASERAGKTRQALEEYQQSQAILSSVVKDGVNDLRTQIYVCSSTDRLASVYLKMGRTDDARREYARSRTVLEPLYAANSENMEVKYALAETYTGEGAVAAAIARKTRAPQDQSSWDAASAWLQKSMNIWNGVPNPSRFSTSLMEVTVPSEVARRLAEYRGQPKH